jgi:hypothetical protein
MRKRWQKVELEMKRGEPGLVHVELADAPYTVTVEVRPSPHGGHYASAVSVRCSGKIHVPISPREVRRLPLASVVDAALTIVDGGDPRRTMDKKLRAPSGRPQRGRSAKFYKEFAEEYRKFKADGFSPAQEIARRKGVDPNTVHQWAFQARKQGFLEPTTRRRNG